MTKRKSTRGAKRIKLFSRYDAHSMIIALDQAIAAFQQQPITHQWTGVKEQKDRRIALLKQVRKNLQAVCYNHSWED